MPNLQVRSVMNIIKFVSLALCLPILIGCGGGGGQYYPPKVSLNTIGINKEPLSKDKSYLKVFFPIAYDLQSESDKIYENAKSIFGYSCHYSTFTLNDHSFYVEIDYSHIYIKNEELKLIKELRLPRSGFECCSFEYEIAGDKYVVIYVEQRSTSHSSTLFILDSKFKVVYQEHLLGAEEIGRGNSMEYGNYIVIKSEDFWFPNGLDKPRVNINGDWLYYLSQKAESQPIPESGVSGSPKNQN